MIERIGRRRIGFDDFRANGLLLPATDKAARRTGLPLHRGPHRRYNEMVFERVGAIESAWSYQIAQDRQQANDNAYFRLRLLQTALRRLLLSNSKRILLNRKDPVGTGFDFTDLDAMAESLWAATD